MIDEGYLDIRRIKLLPKASKEESLNQIIDTLQYSDIKNIEEIRKAIFHREEIMSTGLGLNLAIPHARISSLTKTHIAIGVSKEGIDDYLSFDNSIVKIIIMIIATHDHYKYLQLLSTVSTTLKEGQLISKLIECAEPQEIYDILTGKSNV